jgi:hypothetical protein
MSLVVQVITAWALPLADRVLLVAVYWRTNLTRPPARGTQQELPVLDQRADRDRADTRLAIATGDPQPGNRHDSTVYRDSGIKNQIDD